MDEINETLDLSRRGLKKIEKAGAEESKAVINLILDQNELQRLDNLDSYARVETLSICNNFLLRMHGVSRLTNIRVLSLSNNGILQIEGLKEMIYLKVLKLAGNNIKSIEHLNHCMQLEHLDLSNNQISFISDISYLTNLKHLALERNRVCDLRQCDRYLPPRLHHLLLAHNNIQDLNEVCHLSHLSRLESFSLQGNPCVAATKDKLAFDYRPFVLNWMMSVKSIDGVAVSAIESLKAEWLYSQGKGRQFGAGQHGALCAYLAATCPRAPHRPAGAAPPPETSDQRKLRLILTKAQQHQQQLAEAPAAPPSPRAPRHHSPRMAGRLASASGRSPERMAASLHSALPRAVSAPARARDMAASCQGDICAAPASPSSLASHASHTSHTPPPSDHKVSKGEEVCRGAGAGAGARGAVHAALEAASKMVPVPESLMSPDYQDPLYMESSLRRHPHHPASVSSHSSASSLQEEKRATPGGGSPRASRSSPRPARAARPAPPAPRAAPAPPPAAPPALLNGHAREDADCDLKSGEARAALTIQRMWRGYRTRNLAAAPARALTAIQAARARQHIQRLTCDVDATKSALESERKIQQLQMQAISALWRKLSSLQHQCKGGEQAAAMRQLTDTCAALRDQVVELQAALRSAGGCGRCAAAPRADVAAQTDDTEEERSACMRRPQSLPLSQPLCQTQPPAEPAEPAAAPAPAQPGGEQPPPRPPAPAEPACTPDTHTHLEMLAVGDSERGTDD